MSYLNFVYNFFENSLSFSSLAANTQIAHSDAAKPWPRRDKLGGFEFDRERIVRRGSK